jgi:hypothetical protein
LRGRLRDGRSSIPDRSGDLLGHAWRNLCRRIGRLAPVDVGRHPDQLDEAAGMGTEDAFQSISYAERFAAQVPATSLVRIPGAGHIPMANDPAAVAAATRSIRRVIR